MDDDDKKVVNLRDVKDRKFALKYNETIRPFQMELLAEAREENKAAITLALLVLTTADGRKRIAHYHPEYGDDDGIEGADAGYRSMLHNGVLQAGERLERLDVEIPLAELERYKRTVPRRSP